jgi:hypothetical protein
MLINDPDVDIFDTMVEPHGCFGPAIPFRDWWASLSPEEQGRQAAWAICAAVSPPPDWTALAAAFQFALPEGEEGNRVLDLTADLLASIAKAHRP